VYAEKCPNSRGVRRALQLLGGEVLGFEDFIAKVGGKGSQTGGVLLTGNYPGAWADGALAGALSKKFTVLIDTLPSGLSTKVDVLLPGATWAEKSGTFENAGGRLQSFERAIPVLEGAKPEGQVAVDLMVVCGLAGAGSYDAAVVREQMGGAFTSEVHHPQEHEVREPDMQYVEL
jgi:NADH dehydrogenase/NADH:ubiquinone oxidoreductase subunit G